MVSYSTDMPNVGQEFIRLETTISPRNIEVGRRLERLVRHYCKTLGLAYRDFTEDIGGGFDFLIWDTMNECKNWPDSKPMDYRNALDEVVSRFGGKPGKKVLLFIGNGITDDARRLFSACGIKVVEGLEGIVAHLKALKERVKEEERIKQEEEKDKYYRTIYYNSNIDYTPLHCQSKYPYFEEIWEEVTDAQLFRETGGGKGGKHHRQRLY